MAQKLSEAQGFLLKGAFESFTTKGGSVALSCYIPAPLRALSFCFGGSTRFVSFWRVCDFSRMPFGSVSISASFCFANIPLRRVM